MSRKPPRKRTAGPKPPAAYVSRAAASVTPPTPNAPTLTRGTRWLRFLGRFNDVLFGVIGVALAPMAAHAGVDWFSGQSIEWVPKEAYVFSLVTWGGLFYEVRLHGEKPIRNEVLRAYHRTLHWWSMAGAGASALAYGLIEAQRDPTVTTRLSGWVWLAVLLSAGMFLLYKGPMLWFEAE